MAVETDVVQKFLTTLRFDLPFVGSPHMAIEIYQGNTLRQKNPNTIMTISFSIFSADSFFFWNFPHHRSIMFFHAFQDAHIDFRQKWRFRAIRENLHFFGSDPLRSLLVKIPLESS